MSEDWKASCKTAFLFDLDGTLTLPRQQIEKYVLDYLQNLRKKCLVCIVSGSDEEKIYEQLGGVEALNAFDYVFAENGLVSYKFGKLLSKKNLTDFISESIIEEFIRFSLDYINELKLPIKTSNFVERRNGMINICPIGRSCTREERNAFEAYDKIHKVRAKMIQVLKDRFPNIGFQYSIGGQISIDVYPVGWDKTYCLQHLTDNGIERIIFFGDKTYPGGNDFEIYNDERTEGHTVTGPENTLEQLDKIFNELEICNNF